MPGQPTGDDPVLATTLFGRALTNPIGLAAGFDKNARVYDRMAPHGFGFVEIGGVTPRAQRGNPRPRVFRLPEDGAVINRLGFPNDGADAVERRLRRGGPPAIGLGINLASNADSADPADDFVALAQRFAAFADYLTLDISCPNTANGQVFLDPARLRDLLARLAAIAWPASRPALVAKLSPDIDDTLVERLVGTLLDARIDGIAVANTTRERPASLHGSAAREAGGLSGRPLFAASTAMLARVRELTGGSVTLIGIGGIASGCGCVREDSGRGERGAALHGADLRGNGAGDVDQARARRRLRTRRLRIGRGGRRGPRRRSLAGPEPVACRRVIVHAGPTGLARGAE